MSQTEGRVAVSIHAVDHASPNDAGSPCCCSPSGRRSMQSRACRLQQSDHRATREVSRIPLLKSSRSRTDRRCSSRSLRSRQHRDSGHLIVAATGGPRYAATLSSDRRRDHSHGIWLCQIHGKLVDSDEAHRASVIWPQRQPWLGRTARASFTCYGPCRHNLSEIRVGGKT